MTNPKTVSEQHRPSWQVSLLIFVGAFGGMALLKLQLFPERYVALGYPLPLLLCLWHRDRRLLWSMVVAFALMSAFKNFFELPGGVKEEPFELFQCLMQVVGLVVVGGTVHAILNLTDSLRKRNRELRAAIQELVAKEERITQQNAELQAQAEELVQQNEELQQQGEELGRQNEELHQQADELDRQAEELQGQAQQLQTAIHELNKREGMLQTVLQCVSGTQSERQMMDQVCRALADIIGAPAAVATVLERSDGELIMRTQFGRSRLRDEKQPYAGSFAEIVMAHDRTAFVDDLAARPDLRVPQPDVGSFRSVLATPLRRYGKPIGVVKVYSVEPQRWTAEQFRLIEWVAAQCSLALGSMRLQDELHNANAHLEQQVQERTSSLQEMINELEHFSYTITHDMRAPLRSMRAFAGTLRELLDSTLPGEVLECLERIDRSAQRMDRLITDALSYSRSVRSELTLSQVDAAAVLRSIIDSYPQFQPPHARIRIEGEIPMVLANEAGVTQCFSNFLDNAVKFVKPGAVPEIRIWAESGQNVLRLWFEDNGIGIPETFQPRLFQMFQRASKSYDGTGVGLALVRKVAEKMGGRVGVRSMPGHGSHFWVELQLASAERARNGQRPDAKSPADRRLGLGGRTSAQHSTLLGCEQMNHGMPLQGGI